MGWFGALVSARTISAYERVSRDDLFDGRKGAFAFSDIKKEFAEENGVLLGTGSIIGRVMKRAKRPGYVFTEADFLPKGTRPGLAAGIPPGKRALRIDVELVQGIIGLQPGDRFDLVAASTLPAPREAPVTAPPTKAARQLSGVYAELVNAPSDQPVDDALLLQAEPKARVEVIVQGGTIVYPLETRLVPTSSSSLTAGQINGTRPVQEMVIALAPEEVAPLLAALRLKADLTCLARSNRPEDDASSLTPGLNLADDDAEDDPNGDEATEASELQGVGAKEISVVEKVIDGRRTLSAVPRSLRSAAPEESAGND